MGYMYVMVVGAENFQPLRGKEVDFDVDFNILTALKGWVGLAPQGPGVLHIIII